MNVFLLPYPPQHIRFYCVLLHTHELSIYILCRFVILGEEHGYSPHTDILKHGNSSRMSIRHLCNFSIAQHSKHTQIHTHTHTHTRQHIILHTHTHTHAFNTRLACELDGLSTKHAFTSQSINLLYSTSHPVVTRCSASVSGTI